MASHPNYVKKLLSVDNVSWTPIVAPIDCMSFSAKNTALVDLKIRTDSTDPNTQDTIPAGAMETILAPPHSPGIQDQGKATRFLSGDTLGYLQAASGTGPVLLTFLR